MIIQYLLPTITISIGKYELRHFIQYYIFRVLNVCIFLFKCIDICIQSDLLHKRFLLCSLLPNLRTAESTARSENAAITNQRDASL